MFVLHQSVKVLVKLFGQLAGLGSAHKNGAHVLPSFFFAPLVPKKKRDYEILCFYAGKKTLKLGFYFFAIITALNGRTHKVNQKKTQFESFWRYLFSKR